MSTLVDKLTEPTGVILRVPRRRIDGDPVAVPAPFRAQQSPPGVPIGHLDAPPQRFRRLNGRLDRLVGMPWPHLRISAGSLHPSASIDPDFCRVRQLETEESPTFFQQSWIVHYDSASTLRTESFNGGTGRSQRRTSSLAHGDRFGARRALRRGGIRSGGGEDRSQGVRIRPASALPVPCHLDQGWLTGFEPAISRSTIWRLNR